jgi:hypothetical protein
MPAARRISIQASAERSANDRSSASISASRWASRWDTLAKRASPSRSERPSTPHSFCQSFWLVAAITK